MRTTPEDFEALQGHAGEAAELMRLLGNANRLQLLCQIAQGEQSVGQIEDQLDIKQPALSQQLAELRKAGLVQTRRESRSVLYSLGGEHVRLLLELLLVAFGVRTPPANDAPGATMPVAAPARQAGDSARFARVEQ
ncbi:ArsR/SmtB family transcription factor [Paraburkholderia lycopersici]|uniref:DNA-binding transcriptional regulator, ArsR family n=1 Tax=Paraburkholderia lycopersici TaxID=416944 RepID=A0A1G6PQB5_9BURK|nr:metalloregulator ArsR/SmtB family transcription factor [Paraburkholderia lycopersici]SDC81686.1 DNA-binding transcriptional regulator, ArsR family [Paraburkholderia lycopersici]